MTYKRVLAALLIAGIALVWLGGRVLTQSSSNFQIDWSIISGGGGRSQSSSFQVDGSIGQPVPAPPAAVGGDYSVEGGYWAVRDQTATPTPPPATATPTPPSATATPEGGSLYMPTIRK